MKVLIVYCHPSKDSFTNEVYKSFERGLRDAGHEILISDLYDMDFKTDMSEEEYLRETYYKADGLKSKDVLIEQEKIQNSDAIVFIYPVFCRKKYRTVMQLCLYILYFGRKHPRSLWVGLTGFGQQDLLIDQILR